MIGHRRCGEARGEGGAGGEADLQWCVLYSCTESAINHTEGLSEERERERKYSEK